MPRPSWRSLLRPDEPLLLPGAYDALSARLIQQAGFSAYCIGGFGLVGSRYGLPDVGVVGLGEMAAGIRDIMNACDLPVLIDGDHGYGDVKNVTHTIRTYERMGAAAIFLEDQVAPKRCGHFAGKEVVPTEVMEEKLRAAVAARAHEEFFLMARTDARQVYGLDEALRRAERYIRAGADGIFVEAPQSVKELEIIGRAFDVPQFCNMLVGGQTPILTNRELFEMGFAMVVHGTTLVMAATHAVSAALAAIKADRLNPDVGFATFDGYKAAVGFDGWVAVEQSLTGPARRPRAVAGE